MKALDLDVRLQLEGWRLLWARLEVVGETGAGLQALRERVAARARSRFPETSSISSDPTVTALRRLFRAAGTDPTRYRPASEALLRRLVKGDPLPAIQPLVDLNNCLSVELAVPCCVMVEGSFGTSLTLRAGLPGESYESLRGPFNLEGKPVLADDQGPVDTPITGSQRVKVLADTTRAWLVAYMPAAEVPLARAQQALLGLGNGLGITIEVLEQPE
jgi:DNA/RNA-binding domain of Phe-tRNA-synthetase-like protein